MPIPKIIHQTYRDAQIPSALQPGIEQLRRLNPGWEYRFYDDAAVDDFIRREYQPEMHRAYRRINPAYGAARADFFRYLVVYRYGGVYLDIKSTTSRPLDQSLRPDDEFVLSFWPNGAHQSKPGAGMHDELLPQGFVRGEIQNWHVIAVPEHPLLRYVVGSMLRRIEQSAGRHEVHGQYGVLRTTGPIMYTLALSQVLATLPHRLADSSDDLGLLYSSLPGEAHHHLLAGRYTTLTEPLIPA